MSQMVKKLLKSLPGFRRIVQQRDQLFMENASLHQRINQLSAEMNRKERTFEPHFLSFSELGNPFLNKTAVFENHGYCYCCDSFVKFALFGNFWREDYICLKCGCIPRERAVMACVERYFPNWRSLNIHESSPIERGASLRFRRECPGYSASQYYPGIEPGTFYNGFQCENVEALTFEDNSIDIFVSQDVFEHIFHPEKAFQEIARVLKPGGAHIFTTPLVNKDRPTEVTARLRVDGTVEHLIDPPEYHGNPVSSEGSLLTVRWGYDICDMVYRCSGLYSHLEHIDNLETGIRAELNEVIITKKSLN